MRRAIVLGVLAMVTLASAGTLAWSDSARWLWSYTFADTVTSPATVTEVRDDFTGMGEPPETHLTLARFGTAALTPEDADRLGVTGTGDDVTVTVYDGRVLDVTASNGETATALRAFPLPWAILAFLAMALVAAVAVLFVARWRRIPGSWPAVACMGIGVVFGVLLTTMPVGTGFAMPGLFGGAVVGGLVAALAWTRAGLRAPVAGAPATSDT